MADAATFDQSTQSRPLVTSPGNNRIPGAEADVPDMGPTVNIEDPRLASPVVTPPPEFFRGK